MRHKFISAILLATACYPQSLLIVDTMLQAPYAYNTLETLSKEAGFSPTIIKFYDAVIKNSSCYDAVRTCL